MQQSATATLQAKTNKHKTGFYWKAQKDHFGTVRPDTDCSTL